MHEIRKGLEMKPIVICLLLFSSLIFADNGKKARSLAQVSPAKSFCGNFVCKVGTGYDAKTGYKVDILSVFDKDNNKICSYTAKLNIAERFTSGEGLPFPGSPDRYIITKWILGSGDNEVKILDTSKTGACVFWGPDPKDKDGRTFTDSQVDYVPPSQGDSGKQDLDIDRRHLRDDTHTIEVDNRTNCFLNEKQDLTCHDFDATTYP
jgi:hypothetical protein